VIELIKKYNKKWMRLDPSKQLMFWSVSGTIVPGVLFAMFAFYVVNFGAGNVSVMVSILGLGAIMFFGAFLSAIIFLTVIWPHRYKDNVKDNKAP
jgi:RsiW-degrading membrane proteinase PrsW (M82 family)